MKGKRWGARERTGKGWMGRPNRRRLTPVSRVATQAVRRTAAVLAVLLLGGLAASPVGAQERSTGEAWAIETAGGTIGSIAGFGLGVLAKKDDCKSEDLECYLDAVGAVLLTASVGATLGTWTVGRVTDTESALLGAAIGSLAGAVAGAGVIKLLDEIDPEADEGFSGAIGFSVTQGMLTALGSRIGAALR